MDSGASSRNLGQGRNNRVIRNGAFMGAIALAAISGVFLSGCGPKADANTGDKTAKAEASAGTPVEVTPARQDTISRNAEVTGSLTALNDVLLSSKLSGRLATVLVREGDTVKVGQPIARLDTTDLAARVRAAQDAVAAARARLAQAEAGLKQQVVVSSANIAAAEAAMRQQTVNTRTGIESAEADLKAAEARLSQVKEGARKQEVAQAETQLGIARANQAKARADRDRYKTLLDEGAIAEAVYEQYQTTYVVSEQQVQAAEQAVSLVKEGARSQEVSQAEQAVRAAQERLRQARAAIAQNDVRKAEVTTAHAAKSQNEVRAAEVQAARAGLGQVQSELVVAQQALADAEIVSPISGQVARRSAEPGQVVGPGQELVRLVAVDSVYFEPTIPEIELGNLKQGQPVTVTVDAYPTRTFQGTVTRIYPAGNTASRSFSARITLANSERMLRPQMFARGRIQTEQRTATLVPKTAILRPEKSAKETGTHLFTVENGTAKDVPVTLGLTSADGQWMEVRNSAIRPGAQIITLGQRALSDGDKVALLSDSSEKTRQVASR